MEKEFTKVCTRCHTLSQGKIYGSFITELFLWIVCFPIGISYTRHRRENSASDCPICKSVKSMIPANTPHAIELINKAQITPPASTNGDVRSAASLAPHMTETANSSESERERKPISPKLKYSLIILFTCWAFNTTGITSPYALCSALSTLLLLPKFRQKCLSKTILKNGLATMFVIMFLMGTAIAGIGNSSTDQAPHQLSQIQAKKERSDFQREPETIIKKISELIDNKDYQLAIIKSSRLLDTKNQEITKLYHAAIAGKTRQREEEKQTLREQRADREVQAKQKHTETIHALDACKRKIAHFLGASSADKIPDTIDLGNNNEYEFAWPRGKFYISTHIGSIPLSASCNVQKKPFKIMWLTVNGQTLIQNGSP